MVRTNDSLLLPCRTKPAQITILSRTGEIPEAFLAQHQSSPCLPLPPPARFLPCHVNATQFSRTQRRHIPRAAQTWSLALASYRPPPTSLSSRTLLPQVPCTPCTAPCQWVPPISCIDSTALSSPRHVHARPALPCQGLVLPLTAK